MLVRTPDNQTQRKSSAQSALGGRRIVLLTLTSLLTALAASTILPTARAQDQNVNARREYNVKAVSIYGFCRFVTWPQYVFDSSRSDLVVGIIGDSVIDTPLEAIASKKTVMQRKLRIVKCDEPEDALDCHITFVSNSLPFPEQQEIIRLCRKKPIMLVGEHVAFAQSGGIANFFIRGGRVQFELNHDAARECGLQLDAKLLSLGAQIR
ncbi:MAG: hypothetical protein Fues2KO_22690 [Fuerstiella sp.]